MRGNTWNEWKAAWTVEYEELPVFYAFNRQQLEEGMKKVGAKDTSEIASFGMGGFIRKDEAHFLKEWLANYDQALNEFLEDPECLSDALYYELGNHEFNITGDIRPSLEACGIPYEIENSEDENGYTIIKFVFSSQEVKGTVMETIEQWSADFATWEEKQEEEQYDYC